jgi:hypothetical protein
MNGAAGISPPASPESSTAGFALGPGVSRFHAWTVETIDRLRGRLEFCQLVSNHVRVSLGARPVAV